MAPQRQPALEAFADEVVALVVTTAAHPPSGRKLKAAQTWRSLS
jgi:hypothetical protein